MPLLDFVRMVRAAQTFLISDEFELQGFDDISALEADGTPPENIEIWAKVKISFEGALPESYKVLNLMIGDWVERNLDPLTTKLHAELKEHFDQNYPGSDHSELDQIEDTAVWTDQLDYMPIINEPDHSMTIEIELVLEAEPNE